MKLVGERLKCAENQDDWPTKSTSIEKEDLLLDAACNRQKME